METLDITMLIGLVLMITALVILYRCARGKSRRQRMNELADTLLSIHDSLELQVRRLETLSGEIASDNENVPPCNTGLGYCRIRLTPWSTGGTSLTGTTSP